ASGEQAAGGMIAAHVEHGGDVALPGTVADQRTVAAAAERQRQRVEQDRLTGAGLAGQHRHALPEIEIEAVDQDDVADRKGDEHSPTPVARQVAVLPLNASPTGPPKFSGVTPFFWRRLYASLYQRLFGKLWPSTAAAVCASRTS